jgi:hypothetical protein
MTNVLARTLGFLCTEGVPDDLAELRIDEDCSEVLPVAIEAALA